MSAIAHLSRGGNQSYDDRRCRRRRIGKLSLEEFTAGPFLRPEVRRSIFFLPQEEYLRSRSGRDRGVTILRFERLAADFRPVAARLAIGDELQHLNRSERNLPGSRLSAQAIGTLVECYREDFERFGYALPADARPES